MVKSMVNPLCTVAHLAHFLSIPTYILRSLAVVAPRTAPSQRHASTSNVSKFALDDRSGSRDATMDSLIAFDA